MKHYENGEYGIVAMIPDYSKVRTLENNAETTNDMYVTWIDINAVGGQYFKIDGKTVNSIKSAKVATANGWNYIFVAGFSGYIPKGSVVSCSSIENAKAFKISKYM